jgi:glycosyltransferase involved in cell wall biosynthesis
VEWALNDMNRRPAVSVLTLTYNHERFIHECIDSVLRQTFGDWQQIIIDDGSTDNTEGIVSTYDDPRIRYLKQEHVGPFQLRSTYNKALELAEGDIIAILEGDDFWSEHALAEQVDSLRDEGSCLSHGLVYRTTVDGRPIGQCAEAPESVRNNMPVGAASRFLLLGNNFSQTSAIAIRREALLSIGGFKGDESLPTVDVPTMLSMGMVGRFAYVDKYLGFHRKHARSVVRIYSGEDQGGYYEQLRRYALKFFRDNSNEKALEGLSEYQIEKAWDDVASRVCLGQGREELMHRRWRQANDYFTRALKAPGLSYKGAAAMGIISSMAHLNILEPAIKLVIGHQIEDVSADDDTGS